MANPIGKRIRHQRWLKGLTQQELGDRCGVKFQQIQKYETGGNRVSASRLLDISLALDVHVLFFFEGLDKPSGKASKAVANENLFVGKEAVDLVRNYYAIPDKSREHVFSLAKALAA
ncbi:transcriptional regulator (plasmid) [Phaeobacter inhibens]|uniref:helix-turn-helix domain-containing protein n=1 Tax=Phaeobacter inhibens TaxID=221822 RepID=UPI000971B57D|nr:helix-turn-helix transcriptional regulator [Phaeobacter inhibens]APX18103.1 transcriptional regulator [Phaeobacter inhibens]